MIRILLPYLLPILDGLAAIAAWATRVVASRGLLLGMTVGGVAEKLRDTLFDKAAEEGGDSFTRAMDYRNIIHQIKVDANYTEEQEKKPERIYI